MRKIFLGWKTRPQARAHLRPPRVGPHWVSVRRRGEGAKGCDRHVPGQGWGLEKEDRAETGPAARPALEPCHRSCSEPHLLDGSRGLTVTDSTGCRKNTYFVSKIQQLL